MRVRPLQPDRYRLDYAELCEAGFRLLERTYPLVVDVLEYFEFALRRRPAEAGEPCLAFVDQGRDLRRSGIEFVGDQAAETDRV